MQNHEIINMLIEDPLSLYSGNEFKDSAEFRKRVGEAEEILLGAIVQLKKKSNESETSDIDENELAMFVTQIENKNLKTSLPKSQKLINSFFANSSMNTQAAKRHEIPEGLLAYVSRSLDYEETLLENKNFVPGFAINLLEEGIRVIQSSIQGFELAPIQLTPTRKLNINKNLPSIISLNHNDENGNMQINLVIEDENKLGVSLVFKELVTGRVTLKAVEPGNGKKSRILDSHSLEGTNNLDFPGIQKGVYLIDLQPANKQIAFVVH